MAKNNTFPRARYSLVSTKFTTSGKTSHDFFFEFSQSTRFLLLFALCCQPIIFEEKPGMARVRDLGADQKNRGLWGQGLEEHIRNPVEVRLEARARLPSFVLY